MKRLKKHKQSLETAEVSTRRLRNGHIRDRVDYNAYHLFSRLFLTLAPFFFSFFFFFCGWGWGRGSSAPLFPQWEYVSEELQLM